MSFAGDSLTDFESFADNAANFDNFADEFVSDLHRYRNRCLRPFIPVVDVQIGSTDGRLLNFDQNFRRPDGRHRDLFEPKTPLTVFFDECLHDSVWETKKDGAERNNGL
jgi:hypothetical protein